jgi:hypothetical protein
LTIGWHSAMRLSSSEFLRQYRSDRQLVFDAAHGVARKRASEFERLLDGGKLEVRIVLQRSSGEAAGGRCDIKAKNLRRML